MTREEQATQILSGILSSDLVQREMREVTAGIMDDMDFAQPSAFQEGLERIGIELQKFHQNLVGQAFSLVDAMARENRRPSDFTTFFQEDVKARLERKNARVKQLKWLIQREAQQSGTPFPDLSAELWRRIEAGQWR